MAHIIEVLRDAEAEARSFLDALVFSDSVSAIGHHPDGEQTRAVTVNWDAEEESELGERISKMITDTLVAGDDFDEIAAYHQLFPATTLYNSLHGIVRDLKISRNTVRRYARCCQDPKPWSENIKHSHWEGSGLKIKFALKGSQNQIFTLVDINTQYR